MLAMSYRGSYIAPTVVPPCLHVEDAFLLTD